MAAVLAKSTRRDPADLPAEPERLLDSPTYEGFPIRPLYTSLDALPEPPLPGQWPFVRGGDALRDVKSGWKVAEAFPRRTGPRSADGNGAVLVALTEGISALVLRVGDAGVRRRRTRPAARGRVPRSGAGGAGGPGADFAGRRRRGAGAADRPRRRPAVTAVGGSRRRPADRAAERPRRARRSRRGRRPPPRSTGYDGGVRAITVDGPAFHNLGASASWELAGSDRRGVSPTCGCWSTAASRHRTRCGRSASGSPPTTTSS